MSIKYRESYLINGRCYGIEDYKQPGEHFFPTNKHKRFKVWSGGCGIYETGDLNDARKMLYTHASSHVRAEYHGHQERMASAKRTLEKLGEDPWNLGLFRKR